MNPLRQAGRPAGLLATGQVRRRLAVTLFFTLIGGGNCFKQGRYLKYPGGPDYSHNRLLLSLFQYMGIDQKTFGQAEYCDKGPLTGLTA